MTFFDRVIPMSPLSCVEGTWLKNLSIDFLRGKMMGTNFIRAMLLASVSVTAAIGVAPVEAQAQAQEQSYDIDIPAQSLNDAIRALGRSTRQTIVFDGAIVRGKRSATVRGNMTPEEALDRMLSGSGLVMAKGARGSLTVRLGNGQGGAELASSSGGETTDGDGEAIIVTGTNIRGAKPTGSPLSTYSRAEIERTGSATIEQFARKLVQNNSDVDGISAGGGSVTSQARFTQAGSGNNLADNASFNLFGMGPSATLTLINGKRLPSAGLDGALTDISQVPLAAIDRIEILGGGASAIYGADAVAGVVNLQTRRKFKGGETSLRYGVTDKGDAQQFTGSQLLGYSWQSGGVLTAYEYNWQADLDASDRDWIPNLGGPNSLLPRTKRHSVFVSAEQDLGPTTTISFQGLYGHREFQRQSFGLGTPTSIATDVEGSAEQYGGTVGLDQEIAENWKLRFSASYAKGTQSFLQTVTVIRPTITFDGVTDGDSASKLYEFAGTLDGTVIELPGGGMKAALGVLSRHEAFESAAILTYPLFGLTIPTVVPYQKRGVRSAFAEFLIPVFGAPNRVPGFERLDISVAGRLDDYSDFGSTFNPKLGIDWQPVADVVLHGSYAESFRAPLLSQLSTPETSITTFLPDTTSSNGQTAVLQLSGGNPDLRPEKAVSYTAGIEFRPAWVEGLRARVDYYHVKFRNRISTPPSTNPLQVLNDPVVAEFVTRNPDLPVVQAYFDSPGFLGDFAGLGADGVGAIVDQRYLNVANSRVEGIQLVLDYTAAISIGILTLSSEANVLTKNTFQTFGGSPEFNIRNTIGGPLTWRARGSAFLNSGRFTGGIAANYANAYDNELYDPSRRIRSHTTFDLNLAYLFNSPGAESSRSLRLSLDVQNIFDRKPPAVILPASVVPTGSTYAPFDAVNASPVGRRFAVQARYTW